MADHRGGKPEAPGKPVLLLFDQALSGLESAAREKMTEMLADRARRGEDQQALLHDILKIVLLDPGGDQVGTRTAARPVITAGVGARPGP